MESSPSMSPAPTELGPHEREKHAHGLPTPGAIASAIIVVLVLMIGVLYVWGERIAESAAPDLSVPQ